jgi:probable phosphomutase (TIGR03848 family)
MATLILVRHGRSTANTSGLLAGWTPGVALDERGAAQAASLPARLSGIPFAAVVSSPLQRCEETLRPLLDARPDLAMEKDARIGECDYGDWTGRKLAELNEDPLMEVVQQHPSAAVFPGGESMRAMQARAVECVREWNERVEKEHGEKAVFLICSHGDIIKALVADALGMHLDLFQRLNVDPCSVTAIAYTRLRPYLLKLGDTEDLTGFVPRESGTGSEGDGPGTVGGGAGAP